MKKFVFFLTLSIVFIACTKSKNDPTPIFPKTELANTTWRTPLYLQANVQFYRYLHFNTDHQTVIEYSADEKGNNLADGYRTYPLKMTFGANNLDAFVIDFPDGNSGVGFTGNDINKITYQNVIYLKVTNP